MGEEDRIKGKIAFGLSAVCQAVCCSKLDEEKGLSRILSSLSEPLSKLTD